MRTPAQGFTLIETTVATGILVAGAAAIALLFVNSVKVNLRNRERTAATILLADKMEELKASTPQNGDYSESLTLADGTVLRRDWQVTGVSLRTISVEVYADGKELVRAATQVAPKW